MVALVLKELKMFDIDLYVQCDLGSRLGKPYRLTPNMDEFRRLGRRVVLKPKETILEALV